MISASFKHFGFLRDLHYSNFNLIEKILVILIEIQFSSNEFFSPQGTSRMIICDESLKPENRYNRNTFPASKKRMKTKFRMKVENLF